MGVSTSNEGVVTIDLRDGIHRDDPDIQQMIAYLQANNSGNLRDRLMRAAIVRVLHNAEMMVE